MATNNNSDLYIYLGKRDKSSVRILLKVLGKSVLATRITDVNLLNLPSDTASKLSQIIYDERMMWEPWIEAATNYENLKAALKSRGYSNIPLSPQPELSSAKGVLTVTTSALPKQNTMVRKS